MSSPQWLPPRPVAEPAPLTSPVPQREESAFKRRLGPIAVLLAALAKFAKGALIILKGAKFATTSATMLVSVAAYALIWGFPFAAGFVALLAIHEFGHWIQLKREGVNPGRMV